MGAPSKVQDFAEVKTWIEEGKTYKWMVEEYLRKYNIQTSISMWAGIRHRHGFERRIVRNDDLIPWEIKEEHRYAHPISMLRAEARRRAGNELSRHMESMLDGFLRTLERDDLVVDYQRDAEQGWHLVPRRVGVDADLIREPERKTTKRVRRD